ncbi:hypothetical protein O181_078844 [Austropuccinia psidii MF-1]|uniref:Integrase catalytic domain-containing protein n=1 Tax=Austropuccinia psidii MF-1 TaxID=1389203 RepID=A0A9Q3FHA5_9BASI|nr:hypothetical protein [Austropuccinia psidii MF-1]
MLEKPTEINKELNIPVLDGSNYSQWHIRMNIHLRSKDLLDVCEKPLAEDANTNAASKWKKASYKAINLIISQISNRVFLEVVNPTTTEKAHLLWSKIKDQYASVRFVNRGRVWMDWQRCLLNGNLQSYIDSCRKLLMELDSVSIKVPNELFSYSLLGKLGGDPKLHQFIEVLTLNEDLIKKPDSILTKLQDYMHLTQNNNPPSLPSSVTALVSTSNNSYKIIHYCTNGKHNDKSTSHTKNKCWAENPHLRPTRKDNKQRRTEANSYLAKALITSLTNAPEDQLILDCGATHHMFNSTKFFLSLSNSTSIPVTTGDTKSSLKAIGVGKVLLLCNSQPLKLADCLYIPALNCNLISLLALFKEKLTINRSDNNFLVEWNNSTLLSGKILNQLMHINYTLPKAHLTTYDKNLWHKRLGHPEATGPAQQRHHLCYQATSYKIIKFLEKKSDAFEEFVIAKTYLENQKDHKLKKLISDRGGEFLNKRFELLAKEHGFIHIFSPPETPQHNGFAERSNRMILEKARCRLGSCNLPAEYCAEAINTAVPLSNLTPTPSRRNKLPHYLWTGQEPRLTQLRTFGCLAFMAIPRHHRKWKLAPAREKGILLGYENNNTSYRILRLNDKKVAITKHATFDESSFPDVDQKPPLNNSMTNTNLQQFIVEMSSAIDESCKDNQNPPLDMVDEPHAEDTLTDTQKINNLNILPYSRRANVLLTSVDATPQTYQAALRSSDKILWQEAINKELEAMINLGVWETKENPLGKTEYKACLCAQGFTQTPGIDYEKSYAPTGRLNSMHALIAFAAANNLQFHKLDVKSAFLNAPLAEEVYLSIPQGLNICRRSHCLRLRKAIYGLRQAALAWYDCLKGWLTSVGFQACILHPCIFYRNNEPPIWIYLHVDNMGVFGKNVCNFKDEIAKRFDIKDLANEHLLPETSDEVAKLKLLKVNFRSAIGSINYLSSATRPDLSFAVSTLSQYLECPGIRHWHAFLHVLRYLKGTQDMGIHYPENLPKGIVGWSDADWGNCRATRRSVTGFLATFHGCLILWKTRKQPSVSTSTAEAEYKALCDITSKLLWLKQWCEEASLFVSMEPITIWDDNQSCINTANGDCNFNNKQMKHLDIQLHFIKEVVKSVVITLKYTPSSEMLADYLTKSVNKVTLLKVLQNLRIVRIGVRGSVGIPDPKRLRSEPY